MAEIVSGIKRPGLGFRLAGEIPREICLLPTGKVRLGDMLFIALDILKKRYARGELSKDEYEKIKKDIS
jgi:hypothetical protein